MPTVASMPTAAIPTPYRSANALEINIITAIDKIGTTTDSNPIASPVVITVAAPVSP